MRRKGLVLVLNCVIKRDHVIRPRDFLASFNHGDFPHKKDKLRRASTVPDVDHAATLTSNHGLVFPRSGSGYLGCSQIYVKMAAATKLTPRTAI
jgi:hypothetical protein